MKNYALLIAALLSFTVTMGQKITFFPNTPDVKFLNTKGDTLRNPFGGGMTNPTFSNIDANFDGKNDLFLFDHFDSTVAIYLNEGNGKYKYSPEYINFFPSLVVWAFLKDYNKDGLPDIFAYSHQRGGLEVYKNISTGGTVKFKMASDYLMTSHILCTCINAAQVYSDQVNMPAFEDMDGDGDIDIMAMDPSGFDIQLYKNRSYDVYKKYDSLNYEQTDDYWGAVQGAGGSTPTADSLAHPPTKGLKFSTHCNKQQHAGDNLTILDADGDGDMDVIYTDINGAVPMLLKNGKKEYSAPFDTITTIDTTYLKRMRYFPGAFHVDVDDDGVRDLLVSPMQYGANEGINCVQYYHNDNKDNNPVFKYKQNNFLQEDEVDLGVQSNPAFLDRNNDGIPEFLVIATEGDLGATSDKLVLYQNIGTKGEAIFKVINNDWLNLNVKKYHGLSPAFGDLDGDGLMDMLLGRNDGTLLYFHNIGTTTTDNFSQEVNPFITDSIDVGNWSTPAIADLDNDGKADILVGNESGKLGYYHGLGYITVGSKKYLNYELKNPFFGGIITDDPTDTSSGRDANSAPTFADLNNNGVLDLICGSATGTLYIYMDFQNNLTGTFLPEQNFLYNPLVSHYETRNFGNMVHPAIAELNNDSFPDLLVGNRKGGLYYYSSHSVISAVVEDQEHKTSFRLYPNPASQSFTIFSDRGVISYTLTNILGQQVQNYKDNSAVQYVNVNVSLLPDGIYILNLRDGNGGTSQEKVVVRR